MVNVINIQKQIKRFISRDQLDTIKARAERLPDGEYYTDFSNDKIVIMCRLYLDENKTRWKDIPICEALHPGVSMALNEMQKDLQNLIRHVEEADHENDYLLEKIKELTENGNEQATSD